MESDPIKASIDDKIAKAEENVVRIKAKYTEAVKILEELTAKKKAMQTEELMKIFENSKYSYENTRNGFKFILYRNQIHSDTQSDILNVTLDIALNGTEKAVYAILKQKPDSSREEISEKISKTVRTVQRALDSLKDKGYIKREGSRQYPLWQILK